MATQRRVEILYTAGCPGLDETRELLRRVMERLGLNLPVEEEEIAGWEEAMQKRFLGSPTVRVRGRDVESYRHNDFRFGLQCRLYKRADGTRGHVPAPEMMEAALKRYA